MSAGDDTDITATTRSERANGRERTGDGDRTGNVEHLVLTTVVEDTEWRGRASALLAKVRATLAERAGRRGLALQGEPGEDIEVLEHDHRIRITVTADALPLQPGSSGL